ncbi:MAG: hypothetical protein KF791_18725 [Verrucomicrobiae bacterium]|nr:hypothetical protein [Verrucomicrobiae bacterium]
MLRPRSASGPARSPHRFAALWRLATFLLLATAPAGGVLAAEGVSLAGRTPLASLLGSSGPGLPAPAGASYLSPRVVPVRTRVVTGDGTRATNFSVRVGTNQYVADPLFSIPGDAAGFHLLVLERSSLAVVTNFSASTVDYGTLVINDVLVDMVQRPDVLIILYEMNPAGTDPIDNPLAATLAGFGANSNALYNPANNQFAPAYAFIGNAGLSTNRSFEQSRFVNPRATGQMDVVLTRDLNGNFFPASSRFVTVQASTGAGRDTVLIHAASATNVLVAPALLPGAAGGFQLVVALRDLLDQAPTNSEAILLNQSFSTAAATADASVQAMTALLQALSGQVEAIASGEVLVLLTSLGSPLMNCDTAGCNSAEEVAYEAALTTVAELLAAGVGAVADLGQLQSGGYYALVGTPWIPTNALPRSVEVRSWTPAGTNAATLTAVLQSGPKGWFDPVAADTTGLVDYRLYEIATRPPVPWPVAPDAGAGPCDPGDEACLAYHWISTNIAENVNLKSIRDTYLDEESNFSGYRQNLTSLAYESSLAPYFSEPVYASVTNQLDRELFYMGFVQHLHGSLSSLISDLANDQNSGLQSAVNAVIGQVAPPDDAMVGFSLDAVLGFIAQLGAVLDPDPISQAALGIAGASLTFAMEKRTTPAGNGDNRVEAEVSGLAAAIATSMNDNLVGLGELFRDIVTDWSKLSEVAILTQGPPAPGNGFAWQPGTAGLVLNGVLPAFSQLFYSELIPARFQIVYFEDVPFTNPSAYYYRHGCVTWRTVICECETDIYDPPAFDYLQPVGSSDIYMMATASRDYPTAALMQTGLPMNGRVYLPDMLRGVGRWSGVIPRVLPKGWTDYLENQTGACDGDLAIAEDSGEPLEIAFRGTPGRRYQLERSIGRPDRWLPLDDPISAGDSLVVIRPATDDEGVVFFRLRTLD